MEIVTWAFSPEYLLIGRRRKTNLILERQLCGAKVCLENLKTPQIAMEGYVRVATDAGGRLLLRTLERVSFAGRRRDSGPLPRSVTVAKKRGWGEEHVESS